jgi:hypothetical protein
VNVIPRGDSPLFRLERVPGAALSATGALARAFRDTVDLLLRPLNVTRWLKLSVLCLFLGGGALSAAFNWSLGSLPGDIGISDFAGRVRVTVAAHVWLIAVVLAGSLALLVGMLYLRSVFRFVLVDTIVKGEARLRSSLRETRRAGRSYFRWLLAAVFGLISALLAGGVLVYPYFRAAAGAGMHSAAFWAILSGVLLFNVLVGLAVALIIVLTDDFVVPIMYAEQLTLLAAWRRLLPQVRRDCGAFAAYIFVRFAVAVAISLATLSLLFPLLLGLFSGAILAGALVLLGLHFLGFSWTWNLLTVPLTAAAIGALTGVTLILLSVVGMPGQVLIQDFGIHFIASRLPSVAAVLGSRPTQDSTAQVYGH